MAECTLCPRNCRVDRENGRRGFCGVTGTTIKCARAALHRWEEPCISGEQGSGAVFFSGCPLRCVYCQNRDIAGAQRGMDITEERLSEIFLELQKQGAANINLVTPTHYTPGILRALKKAKEQGLSLPIVYNCSGYESVRTLRLLDGSIDIYLTDFKYMEEEPARRYSHAPDYPKVAKAALEEMVRQVGVPVFDTEGMMKKGVIVRHLLLPNHVKNAKKVVKYVYETYGDSVYLSLMNQYTPLPGTEACPKLGRRVTKREYERLLSYTISLGVEKAFIQEGETAKESFIPAFDCEGVAQKTNVR